MEVNRTDRVDNRMNVRSDRNDAKLGDFRDFTKSYTSIFFPDTIRAYRMKSVANSVGRWPASSRNSTTSLNSPTPTAAF